MTSRNVIGKASKTIPTSVVIENIVFGISLQHLGAMEDPFGEYAVLVVRSKDSKRNMGITVRITTRELDENPEILEYKLKDTIVGLRNELTTISFEM